MVATKPYQSTVSCAFVTEPIASLPCRLRVVCDTGTDRDANVDDRESREIYLTLRLRHLVDHHLTTIFHLPTQSSSTSSSRQPGLSQPSLSANDHQETRIQYKEHCLKEAINRWEDDIGADHPGEVGLPLITALPESHLLMPIQHTIQLRASIAHVETPSVITVTCKVTDTAATTQQDRIASHSRRALPQLFRCEGLGSEISYPYAG